jgi:2-keto-4-pentenoate hydratase
MLAMELIRMRRDGVRRRFEKREVAPTVHVAYENAATGVGLTGRPIAGWKLGATTAATRAAFSTDEIYFGPILDCEIWFRGASGALPNPVQFRGEAEIAFRLASDFEPSAKELAKEDPSTLFDAWAPALESPSSVVENLPEAGLTALLMDRCAAGGLFLGVARHDLYDPAIGGTLEILLDENVVAAGRAANLILPPLEAARKAVDLIREQGFSLRRGQWISTGGVTPCVELRRERTVSLRLGGEEALAVCLPPRFGGS